MNADYHDLKYKELIEKIIKVFYRVYNEFGQIAAYNFAHIYRNLLGSVIPVLTPYQVRGRLRNPGCFLDSPLRGNDELCGFI